MNDNAAVIPHIRECTNQACAFRFPVTEFDKNFQFCPKCKSDTQKVCEFPHIDISKKQKDGPPDIRISFVLDNLRSVFNVGSIFRSSDGCGIVKHLYLCGTTPTPEHPKLPKTALGAEQTIHWSYHPNGLHLVQKLIKEGNKLVALELTETSTALSEFVPANEQDELIFVVGNEVVGVDPEILAIIPQHVHLPMHGIKESLNVAIAASILCYNFH